MNSSLNNFCKLNNILSDCDVSIAYEALPDEIDFTSIPLTQKIFKNLIQIPINNDSDPHKWSENCRCYCKGKNTCILIPGRKFDIHGTRHGRGGGWYDRFLSKVPKDWIRIGITCKSNFSFSVLSKQSWDEPVDWIIVKDGDSWQVHETEARFHKI
jgi:5-formyltetrahydrofolate cyclo-ligase